MANQGLGSAKSEAVARGSTVAALTASGIIAQQVAGKAVRDALFLSNFHVKSLPFVMAAAAVLSLAAVAWTSRTMSNYAPHRVLLALFGASGLAFTLEWVAAPFAPRAVAVATYVHMAVLSPVILSAFWSLVNEHFDPHTARTAVARIATGGTLGGVLGGLAAWRASTLISVPSALLLLAAVSFLCLFGTFGIQRRDPKPSPKPTETPAEEWALGTVLGAPYLRNLALLVAVGSAMSSLLDYVLSVQVTATLGTGAPLLAFFSLFGVAVSVISFLLQVSLGRVAMEKVGVAVNIAVLPAIVILGGAFGLAVPGLLSGTLLRGAEMVQRNTLFRSAYELLYTPLKEQQKRAAKAIIDVGFDRLGTVLGSGVVMAATALTLHSQGILLGFVVLLAGATLPVARYLHYGYVDALKVRLRDAPPSLHDDDMRKPQALDDRAGDALIEKVERVRQHDDKVPGRAARTLDDRRRLIESVDALLSNDAPRARGALSGWDESCLPLVPFAMLLLANEELQADARRALRAVANEVTGQLLDALLDPAVEFRIRRRIPAVLAAARSQRAADGLLLGLADERFEVRYACVRALMRVVDRAPDLTFDHAEIVASIQREITRATGVFSELDDGVDDDSEPHLDIIARDRVTRSVEILFSLLSLIIERDGLRLCLRALHGDDDHQRGTALEYLQAVLPVELRDELLLLLAEAGPIPSGRPAGELLQELAGASTQRPA